jgi:hypothetical protein
MPAAIIPISTDEGNRRRAPRLRTWIRTDFSPLVGHGQGSLEVGAMQRAVAADLSGAGLFLTEVGYLRVGSTIHLFLRLPDLPGNPVVCYAKVVRCQPDPANPGYGIRFLHLAEADAERVERYVRGLRDRARRGLGAAATIELGLDDIQEVA